MDVHRELEHAAQILAEERDYNLKLHEETWGGELTNRWTPDADPALHFHRVVPVHVDGRTPTYVKEAIIPFPSAPIYGINRKAEYGKPLKGRPNMHSVRLLTRPDEQPIHRLFILHNGLNEADSLKFYYQLADWIMRQQEVLSPDERAACLVMPFPGHLMHSSFHGPFSETPLARYLTDAGDLFRQFLKYMIGMRWLLSIVADSDAEHWMVGGDLLDSKSRCQDLVSESARLYEMSEKRLEKAARIVPSGAVDESREIVDIGEMTSSRQVKSTDKLLRAALGRGSRGSPRRLKVHVVGYSLGGFVAQSVFFAWPQVVSSCTTICSGGAIGALSPTAFAQPEEWQSVLHALRPEMTNSMLQGRLGDDERNQCDALRPVDRVAGMPLKQYGYFQRIFEQVFLQEDRGSYKERLSEYGLRMLFISGGEDPIVPPANILDASPREGTTMLSVAGMTHFLNQDPKDEGDRREREQRDFWLPEAGGLIARSAVHAEAVHMDERAAAAKFKAKRKRPANALGLGPDSSDLLSNGYIFEAALDWVLNAVEKDNGWLLICRNALPAAFLDPREFTNWGTGMHHHDLRIQRYTLGLRHRAGMLRRIRHRTTLVLPEQLEQWFVNLSARFEPHSDAPGGRLTTASDRRRIWNRFEKSWWSTTRFFESGDLTVGAKESGVDAERFATSLTDWIPAERRYLEATHLPDVWIGIQPGSELVPTRSGKRNEIHQTLVDGIADVLGDQVKLRDVPTSKKKPQTPSAKLLKSELAGGGIRIVQISGAEFNPRYRGRIDRSSGAASRLLARTAAGLIRSAQIPNPKNG